jgi:hypothetical protein
MMRRETDEHVTHWAGMPVVDWEPGTPITDPAATAYRLGLSWEEVMPPRPIRLPTGWLARLFGRKPTEPAPSPSAPPTWMDRLASFLEQPAARQVAGLVVGMWGEPMGERGSAAVVETLVAAHERLPALRALFLGDLVQEESEISWIEQSDVSPLFTAYPGLEHFWVRGSNGLSLGRLRHERLRTLVVQSGGLPAAVVREIAAAELPALEHLELWLGEEDYGGDSTVVDLAPLLTGERFPQLRYLGLRDSEHADDVAVAVAGSPLLERVRVLDLSLGTLGDRGAEALLANPAVARLEKLDLHHHFCSEAMVARLEGLGIPVDVSERLEPEDGDGPEWRYVAVGE